jgi:hypothetical protein
MVSDVVVDGTLDPNRIDEQARTSADRPDHIARSIAGHRADPMILPTADSWFNRSPPRPAGPDGGGSDAQKQTSGPHGERGTDRQVAGQKVAAGQRASAADEVRRAPMHRREQARLRQQR